MPQGIQALALLPGFVSARIARALSAQSQQSELERIIEALIFSFFTYVVYILMFGTRLPIEWTPQIEVHRWRIVVLAATACMLGFCWGILRSRDLILRPLRNAKLTVRTSRESVWNDAFYSLDGTAQVGLHDGRNLIGWISRYSDSGGERSLFLEKASWVKDDGSLIEIAGRGILLTDKAEIEYVMFLDNVAPLNEEE